MKRNLLLVSAFLMILNCGLSQIADSVSLGALYTNQVFYKLSDGTKTNTLSSEWDLQIFTDYQTASIRINSGFGVELYAPSNTDTSGFTSTTIDTVGSTRLRGDNLDWENDAFTSQQTGHPNYGWGVYNGTDHSVRGNKVFIIKLTSGAWKKIIIRGLFINGDATFDIANLDGTGLVSKTINRNTYSTKHHFYYDIENDVVLDSEPLKNEWELVFRKYEQDLGFPGFYKVTGALSNYNTGIAEVRHVEVNTAKANWHSYTFDSTVNVVGYDWKKYNSSIPAWVIKDSLSYFIKDNSGDIYQVIFTGTGGMANGKMYFTKELISAASIQKNSPFANIGIYPNPVQNVLTVNYELAKQVNNLTFTLMDLNGRVIKNINTVTKTTGFNQGKISLANINKGVYVLLIKSDNYTVSKRIVKN